MSEEEILQELNDHLPYDYCRSEGTEDSTYQEWIDEDSWQFQLKLLVENKNKEIERLNNIINKGIQAINVYQNEKTLSVGYQDLKRIRGILQGNEFDLQMFEEYLQSLKGGSINE